jgi:hypothetical protein
LNALCILYLCTAVGGEPVALDLVETLAIEHPLTYHVQGLSGNDRWYFLSSVEKQAKTGWLFVIDRRTHKAARSLRVALGEQYHPGGMQLRDGKLYLPLAEYRPKSTSTILVIDAGSFVVERTIPVNDHIGAVAVAEDGTLFAANWDAREIRTLDPMGNESAKQANPTGVAYQDMEWHAGQLWCAGGAKVEGQTVGVVDVLDATSLTPIQRYVLQGQLKTGGSNFAHEGFTKEGDRLLFVPEDGPNSTIYVFELPRE